MKKTALKNEVMLGSVSGLYSQGIKCGGFLFTTQIGNVQGGKIVSDSMYEQTVQAIRNAEYVLTEGGMNLKNLVKCTIYITDMEEYDQVNQAYKEMIPEPYPVRACIQVSRLSPGSKVEIEFTAYEEE